MQYVVIETGGKQYKVTEGSVIEVERLDDAEGEKVALDKVLLFVDGDTIKVGTPYLEGVSVEGKLVKNLKGDKIRVAKFRAKSKYRKVIGHRQMLSQVQIEHIKEKKSKEEK